jgi:phosphoglycolate phosphatase
MMMAYDITANQTSSGINLFYDEMSVSAGGVAENTVVKHGGNLYPELENTLIRLKENYHLYIVSNCQSGYIEAFLDYYGFGKYFDDIECYGNNLFEKGDNIALIVKRNNLDKAWYIGDIQGDYDATMKAGLDFIHAAYGFGTIEQSVPELENFSDLPELMDTLSEKSV